MNFKIICLLFVPIFLTTKCQFSNFYSDPDDQGLSRFTSRDYNVSSTYINEQPYRNEGMYPFLLRKDSSGTAMDTLRFSWPLWSEDSGASNMAHLTISFLLLMPADFTKNNFIAFNGQRFLNSVPFTLQDANGKITSGMGTLYFVSVKEKSYPSEKTISISGLFDGNIGDSIHVTKGRFDYKVDERSLNF